MSTRINSLVWGLVLTCGAGLTAQTGVRLVQPPRPGVTFAEAWRPANTKTDTKVIGTVIDIRQVPVAYARVQLRNLVTGTVTQEGEANGNGEYEFLVEMPGTYVVEMTMVDGYVLALSNAGSIARYETLQTVVQLPGRWDPGLRNMTMPQNAANFLGMSAQTTMTAATLTLAADQNISPVDAGEPVSPVRP
jgi:hypothetical protein